MPGFFRTEMKIAGKILRADDHWVGK